MSKLNINSNYKEFISEDKAESWIITNYAEWIKSLQRHRYTADSNDIADILFCYTGNTYTIINNLMRGIDGYIDDETKKEYYDKIDVMKKEISKFTISEDIVLWRYVHNDYFNYLLNGRRSKSGAIFTEKSFVETTLLSDNLKDFANEHKYKTLLKLYIPKGIKGVPVEFDEGCLDEKEFILSPNCTFEIEKVHHKFFNHISNIYECKLIKQN